MPRIEPVNLDTATGKSKELLDGVQKKLGMVPNIMRTFAQSPALLQAYLGFSGGLSQGVLPPKLREQIALAVSEQNGCGYCVAAHTAIGKALGLSPQEASDARRGVSPDGRTEAALHFAVRIVETRGWVTDDDLGEVRQAGYTDAEIVEIVGNTALILFANYFNHVVKTDVDFPAPETACTCG